MTVRLVGWGLAAVGVGAAVYFGLIRESTVERCRRVDSEAAQDWLTPGAHDPIVRPSDAAWYAEHCRDGRPR